MITDWILTPRSSFRTRALKALALFILFIVSSSILSSCASNATIRDVQLSYNAVKTVVASNMPHGVKRESSNGRELSSGYFAVDTFAPEKEGMTERAYAQVKILGAARPYNLDVKVFRETKSNGIFRSDGVDRGMTKVLAERMKQALADRREDRNVIDDFRAF